MAGAVRLNEKRLYRVCNAAVLACMGLLGGARLLGIQETSRAWPAAAVLAFCLAAAVDFLKMREKLICVLAAAACLWAAVAFAGLSESLGFFRAYLAWLWGNGGMYEQWAVGIQALTAAVIAAGAYLTELLLERSFWLKALFAALLASGLLSCMFARIQLPHLGVALLLSYIAMVCVEWIQKRWERVRSGSGRVHMLWIMPFLALYLLLLAGTPAPEQPYGWPWVESICQRLQETFRQYTQRIHWGGREGFGMAFSGFSEDGSLLGNLGREKREAMTVRITDGDVRNIYLTGKIYDSFDGRQWTKKDSQTPMGMFLDTAQTRCAVRRFNRQYQRDYLKDVELGIRYRYFNTQFLFAPLKSWWIKGEGKELDYEDDLGTLTFKRDRGYGTEYRLSYCQMNSGQEEFYRFLEEAGEDGQLDQEILDEMGRRKKGSGEEADQEMLLAYRQEIAERYLEVAPLSRQVSDYLEDMTRGAETEVGKLRAIERELSTYTYTRTPGNLPKSVSGQEEFLDYFLLESRQGYCTYFATAFVLLARASGIPARYVEGYCVPVEDKEETAVYSDMAHAWPEAYISGVGWIPFEPTPGYGAARHASWAMWQPKEEEVDAEGTDKPGSGVAQGDGAKEEAVDADEADGADLEADSEAGSKEETAEDGSGRYWAMAAILLGTVLAACGAMLALGNGLGRYRYGRMDLEQRFRAQVRRNLMVLAMLGLARAEHETLQELRERGRRSKELIEEVNNGAAFLFLENYESVVYGAGEATEEMLEGAVAEGQSYLAHLKQARKWAYLYCRLRPWSFL